MKKVTYLGGLVFTAVMLLFIACSAPAPKPAPTSAPPAAPAASKPATGEDVAWQKVIDDAKKEGKVMIYASAISPGAVKALSDGFQSKYGIAAEWLTATGAGNLEKIKTEQASRAYSADLYFAGSGVWIPAKAAKVVTPLKDLPVAKEQGVWRTAPYSFDPQDQTFLMALDEAPVGGLGFFVNSKLVPPDKEPRTWQDLLDPQWKGKISMFDPSIGGPGADIMVLLRRGKVVSADYFEKLAKQDPIFTRDYRGQLDALSRGDQAIGVGGAFGIFAPPLVDAGAPLKLLFPKEGVPIVGMAFAGVANAPHPNAARLFANWVFTKEGQDVWQKAAQGVSVRTDVTNYAAPYLRIPAGTPTFTHTWETLAQEQDEVKAGLAAKIFGIK